MDQDITKDNIYEKAGRLAEENTEESLKEAMELYQSIKGWKDADRLYISCRTRLGQQQWQTESARLKDLEENHEKRQTRRRRTWLTVLVSVLLCFATVATVTLVRFARYNKAAEYFTAGEYKRAADAFMKMGDYRDAKARVQQSAVGLYRLRRYEEALPYFIWLDGYMDNGYYLRKCQEHLSTEQ